jgi:hypothetical protein
MEDSSRPRIDKSHWVKAVTFTIETSAIAFWMWLRRYKWPSVAHLYPSQNVSITRKTRAYNTRHWMAFIDRDSIETYLDIDCICIYDQAFDGRGAWPIAGLANFDILLAEPNRTQICATYENDAGNVDHAKGCLFELLHAIKELWPMSERAIDDYFDSLKKTDKAPNNNLWQGLLSEKNHQIVSSILQDARQRVGQSIVQQALSSVTGTNLDSTTHHTTPHPLSKPAELPSPAKRSKKSGPEPFPTEKKWLCVEGWYAEKAKGQKGLSQVAYCGRQGVGLSTLGQWMREYRSTFNVDPYQIAPSRLAEVNSSS